MRDEVVGTGRAGRKAYEDGNWLVEGGVAEGTTSAKTVKKQEAQYIPEPGRGLVHGGTW